MYKNVGKLLFGNQIEISVKNVRLSTPTHHFLQKVQKIDNKKVQILPTEYEKRVLHMHDA
jgi:hypothetical protein